MSQLVFGKDSEELKKLRRVRNVVDYVQFLLLGLVVVGALMWIFAGSDAGSETGRSLLKTSAITFFVTQGLREIIGYFQRRNLKEISRKRDVAGDAGRRDVEKRETNKLLEEKPFSPAQSVMEDSTELLFAENKTRRLD